MKIIYLNENQQRKINSGNGTREEIKKLYYCAGNVCLERT